VWRLVVKGKLIKPAQWANDSESFTLVMDHAYRNHPSAASLPDEKDILHYHDTRNKLYHKEKSVSVTKGIISKYSDIGKVLLSAFFGFATTDEAWAAQIKAVRASFSSKPPQILVPITYRKEDSIARADGIQALTQKEVIPIVAYCFTSLYTRPPSIDELVSSMQASGISIDKNTLGVHLTHLRDEKVIKAKMLAVTNRHRRKLARTYEFRRIQAV
jgi:hypothetical protein